MSKVVLGVGTSHSPILTFGADLWWERSASDRERATLNLSDGRLIPYAELAAERQDKYAHLAVLERLQQQSDAAQKALDHLADEIEAAAPDVVVIVGDDHKELFGPANMPAIALFCGDEIMMHPWAQAQENPPAWLRASVKGYSMDAAHRHKAAPQVATAMAERLSDSGVDVATVSTIADPLKAGFGHAFGFVIERLFRGRSIPVVPVILNTYYAPNVPTSARCYDVGCRLRDAIEDIPGDVRVAIIASGGLSHFVTDEHLDRRVLQAMQSEDAEVLRTVPRAALKLGSSEILCWIVAAGALRSMRQDWVEYIPVYRTPAGTGIGLAFALWHPVNGT